MNDFVPKKVNLIKIIGLDSNDKEKEDESLKVFAKIIKGLIDEDRKIYIQVDDDIYLNLEITQLT